MILGQIMPWKAGRSSHVLGLLRRILRKLFGCGEVHSWRGIGVRPDYAGSYFGSGRWCSTEHLCARGLRIRENRLKKTCHTKKLFYLQPVSGTGAKHEQLLTFVAISTPLP